MFVSGRRGYTRLTARAINRPTIKPRMSYFYNGRGRTLTGCFTLRPTEMSFAFGEIPGPFGRFSRLSSRATRVIACIAPDAVTIVGVFCAQMIFVFQAVLRLIASSY